MLGLKLDKLMRSILGAAKTQHVDDTLEYREITRV